MRINGPVENSIAAIPNGQITILSLVVQRDGNYRVYTNGAEVMSGLSGEPFKTLVPGVAGSYADNVTIGRNAPDGWTAFNGDVGDVFCYRTALTDSERQRLETYIANKLSPSAH